MRYRLLRQDDNGQIALLGEYETREQVERAKAFFEDKAHKQAYWIEVGPSS